MLSGYRGHLDAVEPEVAGWVMEIAHPGSPIAISLAIDGKLQLTTIADRPRPDVVVAGLADRNCGFSVALPAQFVDGAEHEMAVLLPDGRDLDLPGLSPRVVFGPVSAELVAASAANIDAVLDLLRRTDAEGGFDPTAVGRDNAAAFNAIRMPDRGFLFYAQASGRLIAYGRLDRGAGEMAGIGVISLTVLAAYRRKGLGERLLRRLLHKAAQAGPLQVWLSVRPDNAPAIALYQKLGFVRNPAHPAGGWAVPGEMTMVWRPRDKLAPS